jgi:uncharacterized protein YcfJ
MRGFDKSNARPLKKLALAVLILAPLALGACAETVGAYAGNQFGKGDGKTAATVGGAAIGHAIAN